MFPPYIQTYLLHGLSATPDVIDRLLRDATRADFDRRPDPERFTIREALAHLADWEEVWLERAQRMEKEANPELADMDEGQMAIEREYGRLDPREQQRRFQAGRERLLAYLRALPAEAWDRTGRRRWGTVSIEQQTVMILGHDGYHMKQIAEWLATGKDERQ